VGAERAADAALYDRMVEVGFRGPEFDAVVDALIGYAYPVLRSWLASGQIVAEAARRGAKGLRSLADRSVALTGSDVDDLVQDTLVLALRRFAERGRVGQGWSPDGGASLSTYFVGSCVLAFADVYRTWWAREQDDRRAVAALAAQGGGTSGAADPAEVTAARERLDDALPPEPRARRAVMLSAAGYTHAEIADMLADGTTTRAVEGLLYRHRRGGVSR
jgi:DNA-directed RNA polymerase specialized sigma24 family protein